MPELGPDTPITISQESIEPVLEYAIFLVNLQGNIASWNKGANLMKGYRPEEIIGKPFATLFVDEDVLNGLPEKELEQAAREGRYEANGRRKRKDGTQFEAHVVLTAVRGDDGSLKGWLKLTRDITAEVRSKKAAAQQEWLQNLLNVVPTAIFLLDGGASRILFANKAACTLTDNDFQEEMSLDTLRDSFSIKDAAGHVIPWEIVPPIQAAKKESIRGVPMDWDLPKGKVSLLVSSERLPAMHGFSETLLVAMEDVTLLKQGEEKFNQAQKMEAIGRLAGGIAHDFNNLLTAIRGNADLIAMRMHAEDPSRDDLSELQKAADRAASLTGQLLAYSRKQVVAPTVLDINDVITDLEKMLHRLIGERIRFKTLLHPEIGLIHADRGQLEQVIVNLVINAKDALGEGGDLWIYTENVRLKGHGSDFIFPVEAGDYVKVMVMDSGHGMTEEVKKHLFEPFFTTKTVGKGTGLGLFSVYTIVKAARGNIGIESSPGRGATFCVYFPAVREEKIKPVVPRPMPEIKSGHETILLVEDEALVRTLTMKILKSAGYEVLEAENGTQALEILQSVETPPNLLLTDLVMPGMNGHELAQKALDLISELRILFMSGYADDPVFRQGMASSPDYFIGKPFSATDLLTKVRDILVPEEKSAHPDS
jgi:PAS domain S-box-containing protein